MAYGHSLPGNMDFETNFYLTNTNLELPIAVVDPHHNLRAKCTISELHIFCFNKLGVIVKMNNFNFRFRGHASDILIYAA
jgi:hypothetical protein